MNERWSSNSLFSCPFRNWTPVWRCSKFSTVWRRGLEKDVESTISDENACRASRSSVYFSSPRINQDFLTKVPDVLQNVIDWVVVSCFDSEELYFLASKQKHLKARETILLSPFLIHRAEPEETFCYSTVCYVCPGVCAKRREGSHA